jgi:hypothetical protein
LSNVEAQVISAVLIVLSEPTADAWFAAILALREFGMAIAATIRMTGRIAVPILRRSARRFSESRSALLGEPSSKRSLAAAELVHLEFVDLHGASPLLRGKQRLHDERIFRHRRGSSFQLVGLL